MHPRSRPMRACRRRILGAESAIGSPFRIASDGLDGTQNNRPVAGVLGRAGRDVLAARYGTVAISSTTVWPIPFAEPSKPDPVDMCWQRRKTRNNLAV
jgi:hypothetical protein